MVSHGPSRSVVADSNMAGDVTAGGHRESDMAELVSEKTHTHTHRNVTGPQPSCRGGLTQETSLLLQTGNAGVCVQEIGRAHV